MKQFLKKSYLAIILIFLYVPIIVLIVQSFNAQGHFLSPQSLGFL